MQPPWWQTGVVYQIYPRSFQDSNGDGIGDLPGIRNRLGYLVDLGIDAVWLSPFYPSPMADFGYDVSDYTDVDPIFGTLDDFDDLTEDIHARGLKLIIDFVPSHSSDQHPWFLESRSSRDNPKREWYVWADGRDGGPPSNWLSVFGGSAWEWDATTQQWYLHSFLAQQPDLNYRRPEVADAILDAFRFWLDRGVDGFRVDVAHFIMKDPQLRDNPPARPSGSNEFKDMGEYNSQLHVYDKGHPDLHGFYRRLRLLLDEYDDRFAVGEIHEMDARKWAAYYDDLKGLHMPFNFNLLYVPWDAQEIARRVDAVEAAVPKGGWPNHVLGNHDEPRLATRFGQDHVRLMAMMLLTLRGTPTLYYGDEIGMTEADIPPELAQDPWGKRVPGLGRDGCRTPMQWDSSPGAGFTDAKPWLPIGKDAGRNNVAAQSDDPASLLSLYRGLLRLRRRYPALNRGEYRRLPEVPPAVFGYQRTTGSDALTILLNFSESETETDLGPGEQLATTHAGQPIRNDSGKIRLGPLQGIVWRHG